MSASSGVHVRWYVDQYVCLHDGDVLEGPVDVWEDGEAGLWGYTCHCGKTIEHDIRTREERTELASERGAVTTSIALGMVFWAGLLLLCAHFAAALMLLLPLSLPIILGGFALMLPAPTVGVIAAIQRWSHS